MTYPAGYDMSEADDWDAWQKRKQALAALVADGQANGEYDLDDFHANHECPNEALFKARAVAAFEALVQRGFIAVQSSIAAREAHEQAWEQGRDCVGREAK